MHDLLKELKTKNDRELRAKIEREEIQKALKEIERTRTSALERDKRRELEKIAAERESLRLRELEVMDDIQNLEMQMEKQEKQLKEEQDRKLHAVDGSEYFGEVMRRKEVQLVRDRGEQIAEVQHKRD